MVQVASSMWDPCRNQCRNEMTFEIKLDRVAKGVTIGVILLFAGLSALAILTSPVKVDGFSEYPWMMLLFPFILFGAWLFSPTSYTIDGMHLRINRPVGPVRIHRAEIVDVRPLDADELRGLIRTFGSGGLFGYYGKFYNGTLGHMTFYATRRDNRILVRTGKGKTYVLTPEDVEGFMRALRG